MALDWLRAWLSVCVCLCASEPSSKCRSSRKVVHGRRSVVGSVVGAARALRTRGWLGASLGLVAQRCQQRFVMPRKKQDVLGCNRRPFGVTRKCMQVARGDIQLTQDQACDCCRCLRTPNSTTSSQHGAMHGRYHRQRTRGSMPHPAAVAGHPIWSVGLHALLVATRKPQRTLGMDNLGHGELD